MLVRVVLVLLFVGVSVPTVRADEGKEARLLLDRAIAALGGEKVLTAEGSVTGKGKGTVTANNVKMPVENEWTVQGTDRLKWSAEVTLNDKPTTIVLGLDRGKGWIQGNNAKANDLPKEYVPAFVKAFAIMRLIENPLRLRDKGITLSHLGEVKIDGKATVGIKVKRKGEAELDIYFDKKTHFPVEARTRLKDAGSEGEDVDYVGNFSDYKKFGDRMHFTKMKVQRDGSTVIDVERSEIKVGEKLDDSTFAKP